MSEQRLFIKDLKPKKEVCEVYAIKYLSTMKGKDGRKYLNIIFSDSSGELEGRVWNHVESITKVVNAGDFVKVKGKINNYQGRKQLIVSSMDPVEASDVNLDNFMKIAHRSPDEMFQELELIVDSLSDFYIKALLKKVFSDKEIVRRLKVWQAGKTIHHAYQSGLLEHVLSCTELAKTLSAHYKVNENYVIAGAILHDMCKIFEMTNGINTDYTEEGKLVGHLVKGVELLDRFCSKIPNFPHNTKLHLKHIIVSHHGQYEYGSPKLPSTREAALVHYIDLMDSKMGSFEQIINNDMTPGHWSGFVRHLDRIVFKAELPFYENELTDDQLAQTRNLSHSSNSSEKKNTSQAKVSSSSKAKFHEKEIKQNLGDLLKGFEVKSD